MVGGEESVYHRCHPVLSAIGARVKYCGSIGAGSVCKLVLNCMIESYSMVMAECFTLGLKGGLSPRALWEATEESHIGDVFLDLISRSLLKGKFEPGFALGLAYKDVGLAMDLGREVGVPLRHGTLAFQELMEAMGRPGWAQLDARTVMRLQEERAGVQFRLPDL